jgi:hypothetical protein
MWDESPELVRIVRLDPARSQQRRPPAVQSISRLQRTVGNRAAQQLLGIGDGRPREDPHAKPRGLRAAVSALLRLPWPKSRKRGGTKSDNGRQGG